MLSVEKRLFLSTLFGELDLVKQTAEEIDVTLNKIDFEPKRLGSINDSTGRHLLLSKFQSDIKRKVFFRKYRNLRSSNDFSQIYVDPNLTKSEREAQIQVRQVRRTLQNKHPGKTFVIRSGRVEEKKRLNLPKAIARTIVSVFLTCRA